MIRSFNYHLRAAKKTAEHRKSDVLNNIFFIPKTQLNRFMSCERRQFKKLKVLEEKTIEAEVSDYRSKMLRSQNYLREAVKNVLEDFFR